MKGGAMVVALCLFVGAVAVPQQSQGSMLQRKVLRFHLNTEAEHDSLREIVRGANADVWAFKPGNHADVMVSVSKLAVPLNPSIIQ
jgi:hypothetical protein